MYEFTKNEIRKKFKETEYGKKVNKYLIISSLIALFFIIVEVLIIFFSTNVYLMVFLGPMCFSALVMACYFDGKRDGAIEQFKRTLK